MSSRPPPRYLPTLTEVVDPKTFTPLAELVHAASEYPLPAPAVPAPEPGSVLPATPRQAFVPTGSTAPVSAAPDRHALAQQLIKLVRPQLEAELRNLAQELFEAQFSALLPSLHLHIEEAVREAIEQALPEPPEAMN